MKTPEARREDRAALKKRLNEEAWGGTCTDPRRMEIRIHLAVLAAYDIVDVAVAAEDSLRRGTSADAARDLAALSGPVSDLRSAVFGLPELQRDLILDEVDRRTGRPRLTQGARR